MRAAGPLKLRRLLRRERRVWRRAEGYVATHRRPSPASSSSVSARARGCSSSRTGARLERAREYAPRQRTGAAVVAYAGHFYPYNGADVLVEALALLPDVRGLVIGGASAGRRRRRAAQGAGEGPGAWRIG